MRLKKIKLAGFKSFVDPTSIPFPDDMTAIVGPNGCGKSNVIDAVRWVLGESSAKNLRGDAMTDVIFNGSSARKPVSQCSVELVFDNSSGRIQGEFANYNELSVKRLVTREAQSFYYLNSSKCRRRDVTDLFLGTGLGPRSYAIIEQGMISRLIESKPQELRVFIEEAAGISKYKERRRETENRIRHTKENLERLEDVRGELGQQLEKLQRQAAAAKRYKDLKARERQYKGELAAIRWLKHSNIILELESQIQQQQADIEAFVAQQRGDEKGITEYKERQADLKQKLTDIQQQYFRLGTDITRLEQNQIHTKQRRQQIEQELRNLQDAIEDANIHQQQESEQIDELQQQLEWGEPEQEVLAEQQEQASEAVQQAEDELSRQQSQWRHHEQEYNQLKQQLQSRHSQIQATMNMQMRTQQRISELQQEQAELQDNELQAQLQDVAEQQQYASEQQQQLNQQAEVAEQHYQQARLQRKETEQQLLDCQGELQQAQARITSLQTLLDAQQNQAHQDWLADNDISHQGLWQWLQVEPGWEKAVETVFDAWGGAQVVEQLPQQLPEQTLQLLASNAMTSHKPEGTLASKINNDKVPGFLTQILIAENHPQWQQHSASLQPHQSVIDLQGHWQGPDWLLTSGGDKDDGLVSYARQLEETQQLLLTQQAQKSQLEQGLEQHQQQEQQAQQQNEDANRAMREGENQCQQLQNQLSLLQQQQQQAQNRQQKLNDELTQQQTLQEEEQLQLEELTIQVEELEIQLETMGEQQGDVESQRQQLQQQISLKREQLEQIKNKTHQLALQLQGVRSQLQGLLQGQNRGQQQMQSMQERQASLKEEFSELEMPMAEQAEKLEELLEQRLQAEQQQTQVADELAEVEEFLSDAEKGQQGVAEKIQRMREALEKTRLECEGYRVRANAVVEQLNETDQQLKPILESLPEKHDEQEWQQELEKAQNSISRLGAVNLAAVEEYEIQSERKQHLDTQHEDLVSALDTLENAIRKIDRETRSRFKDTYDKVNNDLKTLFPKVFGGGSAYLDLTDDDLLETGVTIMARPPGKKNSTIHLLSGGEKALTALSLVFAIFRLNPAPFCLLDEVDAPLDDANVGRFCKLVSEMSKSVQFIYITHNKIAMEMASHLTGVTMAEPGVSRMVAVDVDEAVSLATS